MRQNLTIGLCAWCVVELSRISFAQSNRVLDPQLNAATAATLNIPSDATPVDPAAVVLSIRGVCTQPPGSAKPQSEACTVAVERRDFDAILTAMAPGKESTPALRRSVAKAYAELLAFENAAADSHLDTTPQFVERMQLLRLRTIADLYRRSLEEQSARVSDAEIHSYYEKHVHDFEEVRLRRMLLPRNNFSLADRQEFENKALSTATALRDRAARGEDMDQLQKEGYELIGFSATPPATDVGTRRRSGLSRESSADVFALNAGEVSKVQKDTYSFVIYKVEGKWTLPEMRVKDEIAREISREKLTTSLKEIADRVATELDPRYFGAPVTQ